MTRAHNSKAWLLILAASLWIESGAASAKIIYVDGDAAGANDGSSWESAYNYLQDALADADSSGKPAEIRVAEGVYTPDSNSAEPDGSGDRWATFQLINGVILEGGYAGCGGPDGNARDIDRHETILSGDLNGDDKEVCDPRELLTEASRNENSWFVVTGSGTEPTATLDGFTVTGASAAGMYNWHGGSPTVRRCIFRGNRGSGMANSNDTNVINCVFSGNWGWSAGGMYNRDGSPVLINCMFSGNVASIYGGGGMHNYKSSPTLINCTFTGNSTSGDGGGIRNDESSPMLTNCILWGNSDFSGVQESAQLHVVSGTPVVNYSCIQSWSGSMGGACNIGLDPLFVDADGADNMPGTADDNLRLLPESGCLDSGDNSAIPPTVATDLVGEVRIGDGTVDMGAYEGPDQGFVLSTESLKVSEGGTGTFTVALAMDPVASVKVYAAHGSGDPDITVESGARLTFDSSNYSQARTVTLAAAEDGDHLNGKALIRISAAGLATAGVGATEADNEPYPGILLVDADAPGADSGASWQDAFTGLQQALSIAAATGGVEQIWVAQGIYRPAGRSGDGEATFQLIDGVAIKGGYAGYGELHPDARDIERYETILSGDLNGDDKAVAAPKDLEDEPSRCDNSDHVVTGSGTNRTAILDGFTITGGTGYTAAADRVGGGMFNHAGSPTLRNCTFHGNAGHAMYNDLGSAVLSKCTFRGNCGGMFNLEGRPTLRNCIFSGNWARDGAGIYNDSVLAMLLTNCTITGNKADCLGGGIYSEQDQGDDEINLILTNCIVWDNVDGEHGTGALAQIHDYRPVANYNCIQNYGDHPSAIGNIGAEPCFVLPGYWADANDPNTPAEPNDPSAVWVDGDYHLKSEAGRWDPSKNSEFEILNSKLRNGGWVRDDVTSPCIDAGDPSDDTGFEPNPNGGRINMGAYGGTAEASKSPHCFYAGLRDCCGHVVAQAEVDRWVSLGQPECWCYPCHCRMDVDFDCIIGAVDVLTLRGGWPGLGGAYNPCVDTNYDGVINAVDVLNLRAAWPGFGGPGCAGCPPCP